MKIALFGFGGHAREVASLIKGEVVFFTDDNIKYFNPEKYKMMIAVGNPKNREKVVNRMPVGTQFLTYVHPTAILMDPLMYIGEGSYIGPYSIIGPNVTIGNHTILNRMCQIGHDSTIGDYFSAMPGSIVSGGCKIEKRVYLGSNSTVKEKITIVDDVTIGLSSGVVKNIFTPGIYGGIPCKFIK